MAQRRSRRATTKGGIKGHHTEWLSLVEISGPFLSLPVLKDVFPDGLDADDTEVSGRVAVAYKEWLLERDDPGLHRQWVQFVLADVLEFPGNVLFDASAFDDRLKVHVAEHHTSIEPAIIVAEDTSDGANNTPRMLVMVESFGQGLDDPKPGQGWKASPATRMAELLRRRDGKELGLITNGEQWMLVSARPGQTATFVSWYASLWSEERITLRAFRSLLGVRRFFSVAENETLPVLLERSADEQYEVTDRLGIQVRHSVELLVTALDRIDRDRGRTLLADHDEKDLYQAAVTVMMRLVFLLYAEDGKLLPRGERFWDENYAVGRLIDDLQADADRVGEQVLELRHAGWARLLATFRAVYGGIRHEAFTLPAYGGALFDPDRFAFLEGRPPGTKWTAQPAAPLAINDLEVLQILRSLQYLQSGTPRSGGTEAQRLSYRALGVEQIGGVYESLLDHTAVRASSPVVSIQGAKDREPEIVIDELDSQKRAGSDELVGYLKEATGKQPRSIQKLLDYAIPADDTDKWLMACDNAPELLERVRPYAGLVREDDGGTPVVIPGGSVYVTQGSDRRATGAHYTPPSLTEPIVKHTLEPLVYTGPAEGKPENEWQLRSPREILALRVCDLAMGSAAFLVAACRYLAERLVEAWEECERVDPGRILVSPEGDLSEGGPSESLLPADPAERLAAARRFVADRCLYGVDKDPMAVEMGKLSLWLVTLQKGKPFSFFDHALKVGDSLLGVTHREQLEAFDLQVEGESQRSLFHGVVNTALKTAREKRDKLERRAVNDVRDAEEKTRLLAGADQALDVVRHAGDLLIAAALSTAGAQASAYENRRGLLAAAFGDANSAELGDATRRKGLAELARQARELLNEGKPEKERARRPFHWPVEFPEVFEKGGFDGFVGNPPFQGGRMISGSAGTDFRNYLITWVAGGIKGGADLCAYMFLRAAQLLRPGGSFGLIATNTIAQGESREVGLDRLVDCGFSIRRAVSTQPWPGQAGVHVSVIWLQKEGWTGRCYLDGELVQAITPQLEIPGRASGNPHRLAANAERSFQGSIVLGMGFVLEPHEAHRLIDQDPKNRDVLFPYLNGEDLNSRFDQSPSRWVINFFDRSEEQCREYPDCWDIIERKVRPERQRTNTDGTYALRKPLPQRYWQYADKRPKLYSTIAGADEVLVACRVSKYVVHALVDAGLVYDVALNVFAPDVSELLPVLNSSIYEAWVRKYASTLETRIRYTNADCFETFPTPDALEGLRKIGDDYHAHRASINKTRREGLTKIYNRVHDPDEASEDIVRLRELHVEMDKAVVATYGWTGLDLGHNFHDTDQGPRYSLGHLARREVLDRLLELNHQRYAEELAQGFHDKTKPTLRRKPKQKAGTADQAGLFDASTETAPTPADPETDLSLTILATLQRSADPLSKSELLARSGVAAAHWTTLISLLLKSGKVIKTGQRRGTRYHVGPNA